MEDATSPESTHDLLLALAGRVDDDMLAWGRELVAVGEDARAVELLTASLVAEHAVLPVPVRAALVAAGRAVRTGLDADTALPPAVPEDVSTHRFTATPTSAVEDVAAAVRALPPRQLRDCRVQLTWRLTPAGSAPGPLPQPVVLVEVEPGGRPGDVLAYQVAVALERAGARASVEVLTTGRPRSAYHEAALREARAIVTDGELPATGARDTDSLPIVEASVPFSGSWLPTGTSAQRPAPMGPTPVAPLPSHVPVPGPGVAPAAQEQPAVPPRAAPQPQPLAAPAAASQQAASQQAASQQAASQQAASQPPASLSVAPLPTRVWPAPRADDQRPASPTRESNLLTGPIGTAPRDAAPGEAPAPAPAAAIDPAPHETAPHETAKHETPRHETPTREADARETGPNGTAPRGTALFEPSSFETTPREATLREASPEEPAATEQTAEVRATTPTPAPQPVRSLPESGGRRRAPIPASEGAEPSPRPLPRPVPSPGLPRRPTVTPISRAGLPSPVPLRRTGPSPVVRPLVPVGEPDDEQPDVRPDGAELTADEPAPREPERGRQPALAETPAFATMRDPLNGPLDDQPLLEPLLEPTFSDDEPVDFGGLHPLADEPSTGTPRRSAEKSWVSDWASGDWAMSPRALADPGSGEAVRDDDGDTGSRDTDEPVAEAPPVIGRRAARHRYADEPDEEPDAPAEEPAEEPEPARPAPERAPAAAARPAPDAAPADEPRVDDSPAEEPDLGLHPESLARLSEADRELLERLQAELVEGRRPRMSRRAGVAGAPTNGSSNGSPSPNGRNGHGSGPNGRVDPPDLAG